MRSPEAARALPELVAAGVLTPERAAPLLAAARGEIVSLRAELRALLGLAVTLLTAGAGLLVKEYRAQLGPAPIALLLTLGAVVALVVVARRAPGFSWGRSQEPDWIVDGMLLLAVGLLGADLVWIEIHFTPLGARWPLHLLVMSLVTGALAIRFDSIAAWSLALATFAAWRGVALAPTAPGFERTLFGGGREPRLELLVCALLFFVLGRIAERFDRKAHFEPATSFLAVLAAGLACASGLGESGRWPLWTAALAALGAAVVVWAFRRRRRLLFVVGCLALYVALTRVVVDLAGGEALGCFWFAASTAGAIALLVLVHRRFPEPEAK